MQVEDYDELLKQVYRTAPIGLCLFDTELRYRHINEWLAEINGLSVERHLGRSISEVLPDVAAGVEAQLRRVIETGEPVVGATVEAETAAEPGVKKHFEHHCQAVRTPDGAILGVSCVVQDVTDRKQAEEALRLIVEGTSWAFGEDFFRSLARHLALALEVRFAFVSELHEGSEARLRSLAYWEGNDFGEKFEYDVDGTPCELVIEKGLAYYPANVQQLFPDDRWLKESRMESYLAVPLLDSEGNPLGHLGVADDKPMPKSLLAESILRIFAARAGAELLRTRAEEALAEARNELEESVQVRTTELTQSELRQRVLLESTNAVPWEADCTTWQFTYVGPQATKLLGYPPQQWLDIDFWTSHIHPDDRMFALDYCLRSAKSKANYDFEYRMITVDGRTVWIHDIVNVESEAGEPKTLRGFMIDITERKQAEEALRVSATRLQLATDATRIGHWDWDVRTNEVYFSPEWKRQLGYEDHGIPNRFEEWESRLHPDDLQQTIKAVEDYVAGRITDLATEFRLRHKDGSYRWIYSRAEKQVDSTGKACRLSGCHIDITDRKRAEEKLRKNRDDMRDLARRLITAHEDERRRIARELHDDLSQRLAALAIQAELLEERMESLTVVDRRRVHDLAIAAQRLATDIQQISRRLHPASLIELGLVQAVRSECATFAKREGIDVELDANETGVEPPSEVALSTFRILQESLHNVAKHARATHVDVSLHVSNGMLGLAIVDNGCGFDREQRDESGIGLVSMDERANSIGGRVTVDSTPGEGTAVRLIVSLRNPE